MLSLSLSERLSALFSIESLSFSWNLSAAKTPPYL